MKWMDTMFGYFAGVGVMFFLIAIGIGGCAFLCDH